MFLLLRRLPMADPMEDAAAAATAPVSAASNNDDDDVEDLYADLDEQVTAALAAAGESGGSNARDSDPAPDGEEVPEVDANEAVDLGDGTAGYSSSDEESDDGLHIVLNEDAGEPLPPPPVGRGEECLAEEGEDSGCRVKGSSANDGGWATVCGELAEIGSINILIGAVVG